MRSVLVALPCGAGLICTGHGLVVTDDVEVGGGLGIRDDDWFRPGAVSVDVDHCVVGGRLPPGAVSAEIVDDRGRRVSAVVAHEVYVAMLEQPNEGREPVVCFRDAEGRFVRRPWAADYPSVRVVDTDEPCPACGESDWDEYQPFEEWRAGSGSKVEGTYVANPVVSCRVCGHEEPEPMFMTMRSEPAESDDESEREARIARFRAEHRKRQWHSNAEVLRACQFPVYVAAGWPAHIAGHGSQDGHVTQIAVHHYDTENADPWTGARPRLTVRTKREPYPMKRIEEARWELRSWITNSSDPAHERRPDASRAAITLWQRAQERQRNAMVLDAVSDEQPIEIDGATKSMLTISPPGDRWTAAVRLGDLTIVLAAREIEPSSVRLIAPNNPVAALVGPKPAA